MMIRPYQTTDLHSVVALWKLCGLVVPQNDPARDIQRKLKVNPELFLVGEIDGKIVASVMAGYEGHRGWINYLAVHPEFQGMGFGRKIMEHAETLLHDLGCPKVNLQVRLTNEKVISFYHQLGYRSDHVVGLGKRLEED